MHVARTDVRHTHTVCSHTGCNGKERKRTLAHHSYKHSLGSVGSHFAHARRSASETRPRVRTHTPTQPPTHPSPHPPSVPHVCVVAGCGCPLHAVSSRTAPDPATPATHSTARVCVPPPHSWEHAPQGPTRHPASPHAAVKQGRDDSGGTAAGVVVRKGLEQRVGCVDGSWYMGGGRASGKRLESGVLEGWSGGAGGGGRKQQSVCDSKCLQVGPHVPWAGGLVLRVRWVGDVIARHGWR
jgi:hypothetical protein